MTKVRVFIDFWNFQLSILGRANKEYRVDWKKLPTWMVGEAAKVVDTKLDFEGTNIYLSYNAHSEGDKKFHKWANTVLARFPGVCVDIRERKPSGAPVCQSCHKEINICPHCQTKLARTIEKGVDTAIVTDLLSLAWEKAWDVAIIVTSDRDYIPAVQMLSKKGYRVINAHFPPIGIDLATACWASIDLTKGLDDFERKEVKVTS